VVICSQTVLGSTTLQNKMEFPSSSWLYNDLDDFDTAPPSVNGRLVAELYVMLRPTGRLLDTYRVAIDGSEPLVVNVDLGAILPANCFAGYRLHFETRPQDIQLRRGLLSTVWADLTTIVGQADATVRNADNEVMPSDEFLAAVDDLPDAGPDSASLRWCLCVGANRQLVLQLQSLPSRAEFLNGRAAFKG
jgi:hypothetical protein